ncbi:MAG: hypothetical protein EPO28_04475 [Saprospiraceae bacterium]|nr:MAG: hypothetical protein EPO28_04475 [Saprospiraceae bacterium]
MQRKFPVWWPVTLPPGCFDDAHLGGCDIFSRLAVALEAQRCTVTIGHDDNEKLFIIKIKRQMSGKNIRLTETTYGPPSL